MKRIQSVGRLTFSPFPQCESKTIACQAFWKKVFERQIETVQTNHSDSEYFPFCNKISFEKPYGSNTLLPQDKIGYRSTSINSYL